MNTVVTKFVAVPGNTYGLSKEILSSTSSEVSKDKSESSVSTKSKRFEADPSEKENTANSDVSSSFSGKSPVQFKTINNVGFSKIPKQIHRKALQRGFTFNIMLVGATGLGKATFLNTLFMTDIYDEQYPGPSSRFHTPTSPPPPPPQLSSTASTSTSPTPPVPPPPVPSVCSQTVELVEDGVHLHLGIIDAPGFGEALDNSACWRQLVEEINRRNAVFMAAESRIERQTRGAGDLLAGSGVVPQDLVHACLYFLSPTGHGVRQMDMEAMKALHDKVNLIPVIAKADTMTVEECRSFKATVQSQLEREGIRTYDFPLSSVPRDSNASPGAVADSRVAEVRRLRQRQPFAVCTSSHVVTKEDGTKVRCRVYPWGTVETDSLEHNDFQALKTLLMRHFMQDLIDVTYTQHYANYRTNRLMDIMTAANFDTQDGRDPLSQLDAERRAHQAKLDKLVEEMNQVYVEKVRERERRLKENEQEMEERVRQMQKQLEMEAESLAAARQAFNEERVAWEMENRDYADGMFYGCINAAIGSLHSVCGSMEKLEKMKKHRRGLF